MSGVRECTNELLELCDEGAISWQTVAEAALKYMSEEKIEEMCIDNGFLTIDDDYDDYDDEDDNYWDEEDDGFDIEDD